MHRPDFKARRPQPVPDWRRPAGRQRGYADRRSRLLGELGLDDAPRRRSIAAGLGIGGIVLLLMLGGLGLLHVLRDGEQPAELPPPPPTFTPWSVAPATRTVAPATPTPSPTASPAAAPVVAHAVARLAIPAIGVDAPVAVKRLDAHQVMEAPDTAEEVAWYDFTSRPGEQGNAVFSGHVDFAGVGPAVFWDLRNLEPGDQIEVSMSDGTIYRYAVVSKTLYREATAPVAEIIGPTQRESVTLITCGGTFDRTTGRYEDRLVVRAERVAE